MFKALYAILCLFNTAVLFAQVDTAWVRRYNGLGSDMDIVESTCLAVDGQGNVYVTGYSFGSGTSFDYATIKYDSAGVEQWVQRYNGPGNDWDNPTAIAVDGQGNVYVTGSSFGSGTSFDYATIKYDSHGVEQWVQRYNGTANGDDGASSLAVDGQGNVYVTGGGRFGSGANTDYATIKYNSSGVQEWVQIYDGNGPESSFDAAYSLAVDGQGNVYVTGESYGPDVYSDYATIKYNSAGVEQWVQRYDGPANSNEQAYSLAVDIQGNVYVTGMSYGGGTENDFCTIKYNSDGVEQWVQRYNGSLNACDIGFSIAIDGQGNVYVTGDTSGPTDDCATIKYNSDGVEQWVQIYNGPANDGDYSRSIELDGQGNVYVTGWSIVSGTDDDYLTIKYNTDGVEQWVQTYSGQGNGEDHSWPLAVDGQGNVYVSGYSYGDSHTQFDYATIKYIQETGIQEKPSEKLENILQAYPNPFKTETGIHYQLLQPGVVIIAIYNVSGQRIETLVNEHREAGYYTVHWDGRSQDGKTVSNGVYFCRIRAGEYTSVKKILLMR